MILGRYSGRLNNWPLGTQLGSRGPRIQPAKTWALSFHTVLPFSYHLFNRGCRSREDQKDLGDRCRGSVWKELQTCAGEGAGIHLELVDFRGQGPLSGCGSPRDGGAGLGAHCWLGKLVIVVPASQDLSLGLD
jgi:hypothetical protein